MSSGRYTTNTNTNGGAVAAATMPGRGVGGGSHDYRTEQQMGGGFQPVPLQEQLRLRTMRSQVAMSLRLCLGQCRVALKFYVLGWTGTLPSNEAAEAYTNDHFIQSLRKRIKDLDAALAPYSMGSTTAPGSGSPSNNSSTNGSNSNGSNNQNHDGNKQQPPPPSLNAHLSMTFNMEAFDRIEYIRDRLLSAGIGAHPDRPLAYRVMCSVVNEIEKDARVARLLPPSSGQNGGDGVGSGWAWSWKYDDWFCWNASERKWIAASREGLKVDYLI